MQTGIREFSRNPSAHLRELDRSEHALVLTYHGRPRYALIKLDSDDADSTVDAAIQKHADSKQYLIPTLRSQGGPFVVPSDLDRLAKKKLPRRLTLPQHINWSDPDPTYDMTKPSSRAIAYEQILREGSERDIRKLIDFRDLKKLWSKMFLPLPLRKAWEIEYPTLKGR